MSMCGHQQRCRGATCTHAEALHVGTVGSTCPAASRQSIATGNGAAAAAAAVAVACRTPTSRAGVHRTRDGLSDCVDTMNKNATSSLCGVTASV
jgi:hypothetical protein